MCGIFGTTIAYNREQLDEKVKRTAFRGPDQLAHETFISSNHEVTFGHNRLSIIDLDPRSNQPFTYGEHIHLVFNGEIYNFKTIKADLQSHGYEFHTTGDTEVICAAYLHYGTDCVKHFNGFFTIVIFDKQKQLLFGARDRMGQKPFYYYHNGKNFEFASQISPIQLYNRNLTISSKAIHYYLAWGYVPDPYSIFNEIKKLEAGHSFTYDLNSGEFKLEQYWDIDFTGKEQFDGNFEEAKSTLDDILSDAVKTRLFADVPVGVFLSGGIDSSLISTLAAKTSSSKVKTFNVKFNEKGFDESVYAQQVAKYLGTDHHIIECNYKEGIDLIENFCYYFDEPFADSSAIPSMLLSKYTKQHVTVALSGDAGDENFLGYHRYDFIRRVDKSMKVPAPLRKLSSMVLKMSPSYRHKFISNVLRLRNTNEAYLYAMTGSNSSWFDFDDFLDLKERKYLEHDHKNLFERVSDFDLKTYLNGDINTKVDRASMAYSLEVRAPLQDHRIVEFSRSLPTNYKYANGEMKLILKSLLHDYVPEHIFDRPKSGFTMPFGNWFKNDLKAFVMDELSDMNLKEIPGIKVPAVKRIIDEHMGNKWNHYLSIWKLLVLKQWLSNNGAGISIK
ncbi:MAG: asparagine synthase (glutamine-hydrolyzing) [Flavobacteriaceae bacterium]|nr:asparagine synthase (glutamine-hydrolyzing) [Flavobacteriaceae bacterium]